MAGSATWTVSAEVVVPSSPGEGPTPLRSRRFLKLAAAFLGLALLLAVLAAEYVLHNAAPIVKRRIIETLSESFNSPVELDSLSISLFHGIEVEGGGLRIPHGYTPNGGAAAAIGPLLSVQRFSFRTTLRGLLHRSTHVDQVHAEGVEIHIPPATRLGALLGTREGRLPASPEQPNLRPRIAFTVSEVITRDVKLFIGTDRPGRDALEFDIQTLDLENIGPGQPALYQARLVNPRPRGLIQAHGHFGPWEGENPRKTPLDGDYTFDHADLGTIKGIGGLLTSRGHFGGLLDTIGVDGTADVPDFSLDPADHGVPLHARFHAVVNGTDGDTTLDPVQGHLLQSDFTARGTVVKIDGKGHDIVLQVAIPHGHIEDFLKVAVKTSPTLLSGVLAMHAALHVPPGPERVPLKMQLAGTFNVQGVRFSNGGLQDRVDSLSLRAQGRPEDVHQAGAGHEAEVRSGLSANLTLGRGLMSVGDLHYQIPGALVLMNGVYSMDGNVFEFKGHVRTEATASQMVGGWKGLLLSPLDHFLKKDGAGLELPIAISGTTGDVHLGLALNGANDSPAEINRDLNDRRRSLVADARVRRANGAQRKAGKQKDQSGSQL